MGKIIGYALGFGLISFVAIYILGMVLALQISGQGWVEFVSLLVIWTLPGIIIGSACGVCKTLKQEKQDKD